MKKINLYGDEVSVKIIDGTHCSFIYPDVKASIAWHIAQLFGTPPMAELKRVGLTDGYFFKSEN